MLWGAIVCPMNGEPRDAFREIVDGNWSAEAENCPELHVMPERYVVQGDWRGVYRGRNLVQFIMKHCSPLVSGEVFNMDDVTGNNEPHGSTGKTHDS